jgi:hypothetical protein
MDRVTRLVCINSRTFDSGATRKRSSVRKRLLATWAKGERMERPPATARIFEEVDCTANRENGTSPIQYWPKLGFSFGRE